MIDELEDAFRAYMNARSAIVSLRNIIGVATRVSVEAHALLQAKTIEEDRARLILLLRLRAWIEGHKPS